MYSVQRSFISFFLEILKLVTDITDYFKMKISVYQHLRAIYFDWKIVFIQPHREAAFLNFPENYVRTCTLHWSVAECDVQFINHFAFKICSFQMEMEIVDACFRIQLHKQTQCDLLTFVWTSYRLFHPGPSCEFQRKVCFYLNTLCSSLCFVRKIFAKIQFNSGNSIIFGVFCH
jgi:hypothetical protein